LLPSFFKWRRTLLSPIFVNANRARPTRRDRMASARVRRNSLCTAENIGPKTKRTANLGADAKAT